MRKLVVLAGLTLGVISFSAFTSVNTEKENLKTAEVAKKAFAKMSFNKAIHDFGDINEGDMVSTEFEFTNTGDKPLVIVSMKGSCGCTVANDWPREPIQVGAKGTFTVKFNSKGKPNQQHKTVTIVANTEKGREQVKIRANVIP